VDCRSQAAAYAAYRSKAGAEHGAGWASTNSNPFDRTTIDLKEINAVRSKAFAFKQQSVAKYARRPRKEYKARTQSGARPMRSVFDLDFSVATWPDVRT
jgi:hypothetical protein